MLLVNSLQLKYHSSCYNPSFWRPWFLQKIVKKPENVPVTLLMNTAVLCNIYEPGSLTFSSDSFPFVSHHCGRGPCSNSLPLWATAQRHFTASPPRRHAGSTGEGGGRALRPRPDQCGPLVEGGGGARRPEWPQPEALVGEMFVDAAERVEMSLCCPLSRFVENELRLTQKA